MKPDRRTENDQPVRVSSARALRRGRSVRYAVLVGSAVLGIGGSAAAVPTPSGSARVIGVTVDDTGHLGRTFSALAHLDASVTVRLVLDVSAHPSDLRSYVRPAQRLARLGPVLAEVVDSSDTARLGLAEYERRTAAAVRTLGRSVSIWEIGNEVNGSWTGPPASTAAKVVGAYSVVHPLHRPTALTLYDNVGCGDSPDELDPLTWSRRYLPARIRAGLTYVLLSYYETQCGNRRPSARRWTGYFDRLHRLFPRSRLGFGEIGLPRPATARTRARARSIVGYYYRLAVPKKFYVGGCFYWYFAEDMVPWRTSPLWAALDTAIR